MGPLHRTLRAATSAPITLRTFESLEEEAKALEEEDGAAIRDLNYCEMDCELWVSNLLDFDRKSIKGVVGVERDNCTGLGGWYCK